MQRALAAVAGARAAVPTHSKTGEKTPDDLEGLEAQELVYAASGIGIRKGDSLLAEAHDAFVGQRACRNGKGDHNTGWYRSMGLIFLSDYLLKPSS